MAIQKGVTYLATEISSGTGISTDSGQTSTAGRLIVININYEDSPGVSVSSVTDTAGNSYTVRSKISNGGGETQSYLAYCLSSIGHASNVITVSLTGTVNFLSVGGGEFYDDTGSVTWEFDAETTNIANSGTSYTSPTVSASAAPAIAISALGTYNLQTFTHTGWTLVVKHRGGGEVVYKTLAAAGSVTPGISWTASTPWNGRTAIFKQAGGTTRRIFNIS